MNQARPFQAEAVQKIKEHFYDGVTNQVIELPTGTGKTVVMALLPMAMKIGKRRMMVIVHREELAQQALAKFKSWNPDLSIGVEMGQDKAGDAQIVIASSQTLGKDGSKRLTEFDPDKFAVVVTDECHHATADSYQRIFSHMRVRERKDILNLGVTATTKRGDGKGLAGTYDVVSYSMSMIKAINDGWLSDLRCRQVVTGIDFDNIALKGSDFDPLQLGAALNTSVNNELIVKHYLAEAKDRKFVAFCQGIAGAQKLAQSFQKQGLAVEAVWGVDPDRHDKLRRHRDGELIGLVNDDLLTEGYDDWSIRCVIVNKPTLSEAKYKQMVGRGTRIEAGINNRVEALAEGKTLLKPDCLILDIVGNSTKHSLHTLPTLFGFNTKTKIKDKTISQAVAEVEELKKANPLFDPKDLDDIENLHSYAKTVDLLKQIALPEIVQISEYKWQKIDNDTYALPLLKDEAVFVSCDQAGAWHCSGTVNTYKLDGEYKTLEEAIKESDYNIRLLGGRMWTAKAKGKVKSDLMPASDAALGVLEQYGITPKPGLTQGEAKALIFQAINKSTYAQKNEEG